MRVLPLLVLAAVLLAALAGCSSKPDGAGPAAADAAAATQTSGAAASAAGNRTLFVLQFAGGAREAEIPVSETFAASDVCPFITSCPTRAIDLTPIVPPDLPVELTIALTADTNFNAYVQAGEGVTFVQYSSENNGNQASIDILAVRGADGTLQLVLQQFFPSFQSTSGQGTVSGTAHSAVRATVVPAYVPVTVELQPGDVVNATGDIEQLVAYPPGSSGAALRDLTYPFSLAVPADGPGGTYTLIVAADEAVRLTGPNRTLVAHRLSYTATDPVDVPAGQETTWEMPVSGLPVLAGVALTTKETVPDCCSVAAYPGTHDVGLVAPGNVPVLTSHQDCVPLVDCPFTVIGGYTFSYRSDLLDEHLLPGTYTASVASDHANNIQAYSWALTVA